MKNIIESDGHKAVVTSDPEIHKFRGSFSGLSGGADFYADSVAGLEAEGRISLEVYLDGCKEEGIDPYRSYSGRFNVRLDPRTHEAAALAAAFEHKSLNEWVAAAIESAARTA
jgi:predicted HicB family RNase H-like nuclease